MPLEIKYKEPVDRPIAEILFADHSNDRVRIRANGQFMSLSSTNYIQFTPADFKQWAAAVYKFSQEI